MRRSGWARETLSTWRMAGVGFDYAQPERVWDLGKAFEATVLATRPPSVQPERSRRPREALSAWRRAGVGFDYAQPERVWGLGRRPKRQFLPLAHPPFSLSVVEGQGKICPPTKDDTQTSPRPAQTEAGEKTKRRPDPSVRTPRDVFREGKTSSLITPPWPRRPLRRDVRPPPAAGPS